MMNRVLLTALSIGLGAEGALAQPQGPDDPDDSEIVVTGERVAKNARQDTLQRCRRNLGHD